MRRRGEQGLWDSGIVDGGSEWDVIGGYHSAIVQRGGLTRLYTWIMSAQDLPLPYHRQLLRTQDQGTRIDKRRGPRIPPISAFPEAKEKQAEAEEKEDGQKQA